MPTLSIKLTFCLGVTSTPMFDLINAIFQAAQTPAKQLSGTSTVTKIRTGELGFISAL